MKSIFAPDGGQLVLPHSRVVLKLAGKIELAAPAHPVLVLDALGREVGLLLRVDITDVWVTGLV